ncbi:ComF family protein [Novosphingobium sp. PhB165]|uniref:ComF family protein n=1 Tax=Novosphingobium sp. PhB165 TaxID=2485105 RepID=UPI0010530D2C|nr:ComF family protein [Novosphingobium sp. PhB165]TCM22028.1 ComF family protein [Novosphingobium sp. PhB165]
MKIAAAFTPVLDLIFPPRCPLCGASLAAQNGLCPDCWSSLAIPGDPSCASCARPFPRDIPDGSVCAPCLAEPPRHDGIAAATLYNDASRKLVLALKHGNRLALADMLGAFMAARVPQVGEEWLVVPVPLHRWRIWHRGYNQAAELARVIARLRGARLEVDMLERRKATPSLGGLGGKARQRVLSGAIGVSPRRRARIKGARIVLVDDVLTSGATSQACVSALKRAGAKEVLIACFARVLDEALDIV